LSFWEIVGEGFAGALDANRRKTNESATPKVGDHPSRAHSAPSYSAATFFMHKKKKER
jgi:hypothetical protein